MSFSWYRSTIYSLSNCFILFSISMIISYTSSSCIKHFSISTSCIVSYFNRSSSMPSNKSCFVLSISILNISSISKSASKFLSNILSLNLAISSSVVSICINSFSLSKSYIKNPTSMLNIGSSSLNISFSFLKYGPSSS